MIPIMKEYSATLTQEGHNTTVTTVRATSLSSAKEKAWYRFTNGLPMITFTRKNIKVKGIK
jgi:hypothetical protein